MVLVDSLPDRWQLLSVWKIPDRSAAPCMDLAVGHRLGLDRSFSYRAGGDQGTTRAYRVIFLLWQALRQLTHGSGGGRTHNLWQDAS